MIRLDEAISPDWLLTGQGPMLRGEAAGASGPEDLVFVARRAVRVSAGEGAVVLDERETGREPFSLKYWKENFNVAPEYSTIVTVDGDSMVPTLLPGQPVMVNISDGQPPADGLWVVRIDDGVFVKRVQFIGGGKLVVISDNPAYQPREFDRDNDHANMALIGRVLWAPRRY